MSDADFLRLAGPELWHITPAENLPAIRTLGLLRPTSMAKLAEVDPKTLRLRAEPVRLNMDGPRARLHAQHMLLAVTEKDFLEKGVTLADWAMVLEQRIFLWPAGQGQAFRESLGMPAATIRLKTETLFRLYGPFIDLAPISSGNVPASGDKRGDWMFVPAAQAHKFPTNRKDLGKSKKEDVVAEVSLRTDLSPASLSWALAAPLPNGPDPA